MLADRQTDTQTDAQTDGLITILRTPTGAEQKVSYSFSLAIIVTQAIVV